MVTIGIALMIVAAVAIVAWPFFTRDNESEEFQSGSNPVMEDLITQRDATYAAIKDLELDHTMGKLSHTDYKGIRAKYETKAVTILQELDGLAKSQARATPSVDDEEAIEHEVRRLRHTSQCQKCGTPSTETDVFCAKCGSPLRGVRCPTCGTRAAISDKFCARCGSLLSKKSESQIVI